MRKIIVSFVIHHIVGVKFIETLENKYNIKINENEKVKLL